MMKARWMLFVWLYSHFFAFGIITIPPYISLSDGLRACTASHAEILKQGFCFFDEAY